MISFHNDQKIASIERKKLALKLNDFNLSQNHFSTDLKANWEACRDNCGSSHDLSRFKIDPREGVVSEYVFSYWPKDSIDWAKKNWHRSYDEFNLSQNLNFSTYLKASWEALTKRKHRLSEKNWHKNYNDFNLSQNLHFSTDLKSKFRSM